MAKIKVTLPSFEVNAVYRIGGLLFDNGVAEVDELSHSDREVIEMLGAEVEGDDEAPAPSETETEREPAGATPPAPDAADDPAAGPGETEAPAPAAGSSFVDPTPTTDEQAAAAPFESAIVSSDTDGSQTETVASAPASTEE